MFGAVNARRRIDCREEKWKLRKIMGRKGGKGREREETEKPPLRNKGIS